MIFEGAKGRTVVGVDETGRGSLIGPVITCAVAFPEGGLDPELEARLADSKALAPARRMAVARELHESVRYAFGAASARMVDEKNPLSSTMLAMNRAVARLGIQSAFVVVDGPYFPAGMPHPGAAVIKGDSKVPEVMAASILAKVFRDHLVAKLETLYPGYGLARNAGYGTRTHFDAVRRLGPCPHHRLTFLRKALGKIAA